VTRVLAVDVGGTTIKAEVTSADGVVVARARRQTPRGDQARDAVSRLGRELIADVPVTSAGVVIPGIVDAVTGTGVYSANVGWQDLPFAGPLAEAWQVPVAVGHDVLAAGLAEHALGAGRGVRDLAFVAIGTGISAALIVGGRPLAGNGTGQPGELGHVVVRSGGPACGCGNRGCLEAVASAAAIARAYEKATGERPGGALSVFGAVASGDRAARAVIDEAASALADGLAMLATLMAPERIVLGGGLAEAGPALVDPVTVALAERVRVQPVPGLVTARFGARAGLVGAALLARETPGQPRLSGTDSWLLRRSP
jgi:glucokinase